MPAYSERGAGGIRLGRAKKDWVEPALGLEGALVRATSRLSRPKAVGRKRLAAFCTAKRPDYTCRGREDSILAAFSAPVATALTHVRACASLCYAVTLHERGCSDIAGRGRDEAVWRFYGRRRPVVRRAARQGLWLPRPKRGREDDHHSNDRRDNEAGLWENRVR